MKKKLALIPFISLVLGGCSFEDSKAWDEDRTFATKNVPIINKATEDYDIKGNELTIWYIDGSDVPYVDLEGFINSFDGFFDAEGVSYEYDFKEGYVLVSHDERNKVVFDWAEDSIYANSYHDFEWYSFIGSSTDYGEHIYSTNDYYFRDASFEVNVADYYFDILCHEKKCILPLFFANTLFCSTSGFNVFYNGEKCFATYGEMGNIDGYYDCERNKKTESYNMRIAAVNSLLFTMNTFYGLKEYKGYDDGFKNHLEKGTYDYLWSQGPLDNFIAYKEIVYGMLDELHTRIDMPSYYCDVSKANIGTDDYGDFWTEYYARRTTQRNLRKSVNWEEYPVKFQDDLAVIILNSFETGSRASIYDENGNVKEDAWKHDSYQYMRKCMEEISAHPEVNDIVLDLSLNGGGYVDAMEKVIGFMTDLKIPYSTYNTLDNAYRIDGSYVDIDGDGNYAGDAYDQYDWHLLTGVNTFSAANLLTSTFKNMGLGKVIGKKSGGGMCSIMSLVLADGTAITISSPNSIRSVTESDGKKHFNAIEGGVEPDIDLAYEDFYDCSKIHEAINQSVAA